MSETTQQTTESKTNKTQLLPQRQLEEEEDKQLGSIMVLVVAEILTSRRNRGQGIMEAGDGGGCRLGASRVAYCLLWCTMAASTCLVHKALHTLRIP